MNLRLHVYLAILIYENNWQKFTAIKTVFLAFKHTRVLYRKVKNL